MPEPTGLTPPAVPVMTAGEISKITETSRANGNRILSEGEDRAKAAKVKVKSLLKEGHTVQEILRAVQEGDYSLIVMGRRGISKIKELLLGSVTDGVVRHVYCPVLVVR
jgi:nucleotide-binding universal stress UspA family protein